VPTVALVAAGADVTVAINLLGREALPAWSGADPPDPFRGRGGVAERDTVVEVLELAQMESAARQTDNADVPITPRFGPGSWRHFQLADYYLAAGIEAAEAAMPALRAVAPAPTQVAR
jgi:hypothetical protein